MLRLPRHMPPPVARKSRYFPVGLGLNQVAPPNSVHPGHVFGGENYEIDTDEPGGYRRIDGYERFDGRTRPSQASYWVVNFDAGTTAISAGDVIATASSPSASDPQGEALIDAVVESGSFATNDAAGYVVVCQVSGQATPGGIADDDTLYVSASSVATADGASVERGADNDTDNATWLQDAIETLRADIAAVPGSGTVRGVQMYAGDVYAWRDNVGATAGVLHKASTAGWVEQDLGRTIDFTSGGTTEIAEGDTVTGATSGATAEVRRVIVSSGTWAGGDAAGRLILYDQTGTFQSENLDVGASTNLATIAGDSSAQTLPAGGRYECIVSNFGGHTSTRRVYGVNGVGPAFEWDGETFVSILTGMDTDTPNHIAEHHQHLFLSFPGGSIQNSGQTQPYSWSPRTGASEFGTGGECVGMQSLVGGQLVVFSRNETFILAGTSNSNWVLSKHSDESGALEWTVQRMFQPVYYDDRGITTLGAVQAFGDFQDSTISALFRPLALQKLSSVLSSMRVRAKNQYRVFFSDGTGLYLTFKNRKLIGAMQVDLDIDVQCTTSEENGEGVEELYFGSDDGFVYQLDAGTSFDGEAVPAWLRLAFNHLGSPQVRKRFWTVVIEVDAGPVASLQFLPDYSYGDTDVPGAEQIDLAIVGGGGLWNVANWNAFVWGGPPYTLARAKIDGTGTNIGLLLSSEATYEQPHTISGYTVAWSDRRMER